MSNVVAGRPVPASVNLHCSEEWLVKAEIEDERWFRRRRLGKANGLVVFGVRFMHGMAFGPSSI